MELDDQEAGLIVVAGEPSGDRAAARVVERVTQQRACRVFGVGGDYLAGAGVDLIAHIDGLTGMGLGDAALRIGNWAGAWVGIREKVAQMKPRAALLVDNPEVNLPLARVLTNAGVRVVYYVGPQVWAWRRSRLSLLKKRAQVTALILPFEKPLYDGEGVEAVYVGHPILDEPTPKPSSVVRKQLGVPKEASMVALLPGSRPGEIARHTPAMHHAGMLLYEQGIHAVLASAPAGPSGPVNSLPPDLDVRDLLGASDAALVASGTATLEAASANVPLAVVYRVGPLTWAVGKRLVKVPYIGLPNWIAGQKIVPELLQNQVTGPILYANAICLLDPKEQRRQRYELARVAKALGKPGVSNRVAALVLKQLL